MTVVLGSMSARDRPWPRACLHSVLGCDDAQHVAVPPYDDRRDRATGVLNPDGIAEVARSLAEVIQSALQANRLPVVLGGDCSIVLGPLLALRRRGRYGLVYLDGHADFQHPDDEPNGEVASLDLVLATGRGPRLLTDLDGLAPLVRAEDVALLGCGDEAADVGIAAARIRPALVVGDSSCCSQRPFLGSPGL